MTKPSDKRAAKRKMYGKLGRAISNLDFTWDKDYGAVKANPWRVLPSEGFHVLQIDTRPGLTRKLDDNTDENN